MAPVFVDTNILVYWRDSTNPEKQLRATEWLDFLWRERRGRTSTQVLSEFYSVVVRKKVSGISPEEAWRDVQAFSEWSPQPVDVDLLARAYSVERRYALSWWDSLVVAAAQAQACALLLTEDLQDGADYGGVIVRNPFKLGIAEESGAYMVTPKIASRHRGRGRPRTRPQRATTATS